MKISPIDENGKLITGKLSPGKIAARSLSEKTT